MFPVLCTVSPSLLAKAWSSGVFPLKRSWQNEREGVQSDSITTNLLCLSPALTSAPISSRVSRQGSRSDSSLARSKGLLSWIWQVKSSYTSADTDTRRGSTLRTDAPSPCPSSQCRLRGSEAASPWSACFSRLPRVEDCSTILDLEDQQTFTVRKYVRFASSCCQTRGDN